MRTEEIECIKAECAACLKDREEIRDEHGDLTIVECIHCRDKMNLISEIQRLQAIGANALELGAHRPFLVEYPHEGEWWSFEIQATSREDAERRIASIAGWGKYLGEVMGHVPATPTASMYVRLRCWWANWRKAR